MYFLGLPQMAWAPYVNNQQALKEVEALVFVIVEF